MPVFSATSNIPKDAICRQFFEQGECKKGEYCRFKHVRGEIGDGVVCSNDTAGSTSSFVGNKLGDACCHFLQNGNCAAGASCKFQHVSSDPAKTPCGYGQYCKHWHGWKTEGRQRWVESGSLDYQSACCHFLQYGSCSHGEACKFKHVQGDPETTPCGFGMNCKHWHGWAAQGQSDEHWEDTDVEPMQNNALPQKVRICCNFLERGSCSKGEQCRFEHVKSDKGTTKCGAGVNCRYGHGWACRAGHKGDWNKDGQTYLNVPNKLLRAVINSLLGSWHSTNSADKSFNHMISLGNKSSYDLAVRTYGPSGKERLEPIRYVDGDFVLGDDSDFFLDVSCDRYVVWVNAECAEEKLVWTRGAIDTRAAWKASVAETSDWPYAEPQAWPVSHVAEKKPMSRFQ